MVEHLITPTPGRLPDDRDAILGQIGKLPLIGRTAQCALIRDALIGAEAGSGRFLLITGETGIGKSRLLTEARAIARDVGALVVHGEAFQESGSPAFAIWLQIFSALPDQSAFHILAGSAYPQTAIPYNSWRPRQISAEETRFRLFSDIVAVLERMGDRQPLVITLDDLQWADSASLELLKFLARRVSRLPVLLVAAIRAEAAAPGSDAASLLEKIDALRPAVLPLLPFTPAELEQATTSLLGPRRTELGEALGTHSEGNPFVLEETLRSLLLSNEFSELDGPLEAGQLPLPRTVTVSIRGRLENLPDVERRAIEIAAVTGKTIRTPIVAHVLGCEIDTVVALLDRLVGSLLLRNDSGERDPDPRYRFLHDWVREVILQSTTPSTVKTIHAQIARYLQDDPAGGQELTALAFHAEHGGLTALATACYRDLAENDLAGHAPDEALGSVERAIALAPQAGLDSIETARLQMLRGRALLAAGRHGAAESFDDAYRLFLDGGAVADAGVASNFLGLARAQAEHHEEAIAAFRLSLALLRQVGGVVAQASVLLNLADTLGTSLGRFDEALEAADRAIELLEGQRASHPVRAEASLTKARTLMRINQLDEAKSMLHEAHLEALKRGEFTLASEIDGALANVAYWHCDLRESRNYTLQRELHAQASGSRFSSRHVHAWSAFLEITGGNWREGERQLQLAQADVEGLESPEPRAFLHIVQGYRSFLRGDHADSLNHLLTGLETFRSIGETTTTWYIGLAALCADSAGELTIAAELGREAWQLVDDLPPQAIPAAATLTTLGILAGRQGDGEQSDEILRRLRPFAGQLHWFLVDRALGVLSATAGDGARARFHLDRAIETARRYQLKPELAMTTAERVWIEVSGTGQSHQDEKTKLMPMAIDRLRSLGLKGEVRRCEALLAGAQSGRSPERPAGLSARELEVVRLIAAGQTNRQIAAALSIAEKTVTNHISSILGKTSQDNRAGIAAFAVRHGLD